MPPQRKATDIAVSQPGRLDQAGAWETARKRIEAANGRPLVKPARGRDAVENARQLAMDSAYTDMRMSIALTLGCTPAELEADKSGARLMLEVIHKRLSIVGLRAGEQVEHDVSDRLREFLERFRGAAQVPHRRRITSAAVDADARDDDDAGEVIDGEAT